MTAVESLGLVTTELGGGLLEYHCARCGDRLEYGTLDQHPKTKTKSSFKPHPTIPRLRRRVLRTNGEYRWIT